MSTKSHNYEIQIGSGPTTIQGQCNFNGGEPPSHTVTNGPDLTNREWKLLDNLFDRLTELHCECSGITSIEFTLIS